MTDDLENVGGIGITLGIKDDTEKSLEAIHARLEAIAKEWTATVKIEDASGKGGPTPGAQAGVEAKAVSAAFATGISKFTAAFENFTIKIDPASITSIASAIREALQQSGTNYSPTGRNAFADASQRATTGSASVVRTGVSSGMVDATRNATWQNNMYRVELRALNAGGTSAPQRIGFATPLERTQAALEGQPMAPGRRRRPLAEGEEAVPAYSISAKVRSRGPHYKPPSAGLRERGAPVPVADSEKMETYRGVEVVRQASVRSSGRGRRRVGAKLDPRTGRILVDDAMLRAQYENKGWRDMAELSDSSKASPLPDELFPNYSKYRGFVLEHEYQHGVSPRRAPGETMGKYDDRINQAAIAAGSARTVKPRYSSRGAHWKPIPGMELGGTSQARLDAEASARAIWESEQTSGVRRVGPVESDYRDSFGEELVDRLPVGNAANRSPVIPRAFRDRTPLGRKFLPSILKAISDAERSDEETGQIATSYRIPAHQLGPRHIDLSKVRVPNRPEATDPEKRTYLQELRIPAHAQAIEDFFERNPLASRDNPRLDEGIDVAGAPLLRGVRLERITRPVRFLEELTKSLRAQGERVDMDTFVAGGASENPQMKALYALAQDTVSRFPTRAASPKQGAGFLNQVPPDPIPLDQTPQMMLKKSIWAKTEQLRRYWGRRKTRGDQRKAGGRTGQSGQFIDRAAAIWLRNITRGQAEEGDLRWDEKGNFLDPGMVDLANQFFLYKLGPKEYRAPEYADTTRYPQVSAPDMHAKLYGTRAVSSEPETVWRRDPKKVLNQAMGLEPSIDPETGKPTGVNSWLPKRPSPRGRVLGLYRSVAQKFDRVPPMYRAALGAVRGELSELYGSRRAKQDADLVTTRSPLRWDGSSVVQERALRDQAREERRIFGRDTKAYGLGEPDYKFLQNLPTEITGGLRETAAIKERDRADKAYAEWKGSGAERAGNPPPRPAQWSPPAYTTGTGESMPWHLLSAEQKRKARPARDAEGRREHADLPLGEREGRRARIHLTKDNQTRVEYPFGQTEEETEAARIGLLRQATAYPTTSHFKGQTAKRQRAARYDVAVAQTELDRTLARIDDLTKEERLAAVPTFEAEVGPQEDVQHREMFRRTGRFQDPNYRSPLTRRERRLGQAQLSGRYAATFREQREEYVRERPLSIEEEISSWHAQQKAETKRSWKENLGIRQPTLEDEIHLQGQMVVLGHQRKRLTDTAARAAPGTSWADIKTQAITGRDRGIPRNPLPSVVETMAAVESGEVHPDLEAAQATAGAPPRRLHRRRVAPESFVAAGGPGGPSAGTPGGGVSSTVSISGVPHVIVDDILQGKNVTVTVTNPTALRPEKAAATAATGTAAATTAAKTPAVPEGATKFGPQGGVRPGEYGAKRVGPGESPPNIDTATMTAAAMAEVRADKQAAVAKVAADKAKAAEAKRIATVPFKQRVEEKTQAYLKTMPMAGAPYYAPAGAAEPVRPFEGVELDAAKQMALREELKILGKTPSDLKADTWGARAADLKRRKPGLTNAQVKARIQKKVRKLENLVGPGVVGDPGDDLDEFMDNVMAAGGLGPAPRPGRVPAQQNQAKILRKYGLAVEQPVSRVGATEEAGSGAAARLSGAQARVAQRKQDVLGFPMRAMSTGVLVGVSRAIGPFEAVKSRQAKMERAFGEYQKLEKQQSGEQLEFRAQMKTRRELRTTLAERVAANTITPAQAAEDFEIFSKPLRETAGHLRELGAQTNNAYKTYDKLDKAVIKSTDNVQHFAASFIGAIAGAVIGTVAGQVAAPVIQAIATVIEKAGAPLVDQMAGWVSTRTRTVEELTQATTAKGGLAAAAFAGQYGHIPQPITEQYGTSITEEARVRAANEWLLKIRDLTRSAQNIGQPAYAPSLITSQGGIAGTWLGAPGQSTAEIVNASFGQRDRTKDTWGVVPGADEENRARWFTSKQEELKSLNTLLEGGSGKYQVRPVTAADNMADVSYQNAVKSKLGLTNLGGMGAGRDSVVLVDAQTGAIVQSTAALKAFYDALTDTTKSVEKQDAGQFIEERRGQIRAQIQGMEAQRQFTIEEAAPMQRGMNWLAAPPQPYGTGWMPGMQNTAGLAMGYLGAGNFEATGAAMRAGIGMPATPMASGYDVATGALTPNAGIPPEAIESFNKYASVGQSAFAKVSRAAEQGIAKLREANVPESAIQSMQQLGAQATALQTQLAGIQTERATTKYNHDLAIANRSLNDAKQLTGQIGKNSSDNVGYYERQLLLINRASTALSLQLQQRQITTQQAIAGFAVQGDTPEIRMARRKEAMLEAEISQKQLGYSKQAFGTEIKLVDAQNLRQVADAAYAVSDMTRDWKAMWDSKAIENSLALIQQALEIPTTEASAWVGYFAGYKQYMIQLAVELAAATETEVSKMITAIDATIKGSPFFSLLFGNAQTPVPTEGGASGPNSGNPVVGGAPKSTPVDPAWYRPRALGPQDRAIWGARLGITPKSAAGGRGADMGNPSAGSAFPNPVAVTTNNTTNNNQKIEISPVYNITLPSLDQEQVADLTTKVVKSINTALALVGLRPVAR